MKALVLFGSKSDKNIYEPLVKTLEKDFDVDFKVLSAHRDPEALRKRLQKKDFNFVVAGAGLAAHLPGVVASMTTKPVFGVAVEAQFGGLDAVMSISQMPYGVPVGSLPPGNNVPLYDFLNKISKLMKKNFLNKLQVCIKENLLDSNHGKKELDRLKALAVEKKIDIYINSQANENFDWKLQFVHSEKDISKEPGVLHVPLLDEAVRKQTESALMIQNWIEKGGLWFGVNNSRNALLFLEKWRN